MKSLIIIVLIAFWSVNIFGEIAPPCSHSAVANVTEPTCVGNNGSIEVIVTGGTAPYEYNIDGGANQPSNVFSNLLFFFLTCLLAKSRIRNESLKPIS